MWETWVWSLGREDPLEKEMATHSSFLAWRIPLTEEPGGSTGRKESDRTERLHFHFHQLWYEVRGDSIHYKVVSSRWQEPWRAILQNKEKLSPLLADRESCYPVLCKVFGPISPALDGDVCETSL